MSAPSIGIVDLGLGNLHSVAQAFVRAGVAPAFLETPEAVRAADRLVVPGQGAFRECAEVLAGGLGEALVEHMRSGRPYLGICLGMQALFEGSDEAPALPGLGWFEGKVRRFPDGARGPNGERLKVPHMGWNQVQTTHPMLEPDGWYYFVHSYYCVPDDPSVVAARCEYGAPFCAAVCRDNVFACQFHPEKSHHAGARVLERFLAA